MTVMTRVRRASALSTALASMLLLVPASAPATPTVAYKARFLPIPGLPGTGDRLGSAAMFEGEAKLSGTEYGGSPSPITGLRYFAPAGTILRTSGFATCAPSVIEQQGPTACPKRSIAGPTTSIVGAVSFGGERVPETASLQTFFAPGGGVTAFVDGTTPTVVEVLVSAHLVGTAPPFGPEFTGEVPLIETVPGGLDASFVEGTVAVGTAYRRGRRTISYITMPKTCPDGGWPTKGEATFLDGGTVQVTYRVPCPHG